MCGITAVVAERYLRGDDLRTAQVLVRCMTHRGPDDEGYLIIGRERRHFGGESSEPKLPPFHVAKVEAEDRIVLGHRRLSIIDLTAAGHQPMVDEVTGSAVVFAGEIYNFVELRHYLQGRGIKFLSNGDTEVLLKAWRVWGPEALEHLDGMWVFCLWDSLRQRFFASRDRFGQKQLYFARLPTGALGFSSEVRPLLSNGISRSLNHPILWDFLNYGISDHTGETAFQYVRQLEPSTLLELKPQQLPRIRKYYSIPIVHEGGDPYEVRKALRASVKTHMRGDLPVAAFLSSGLDSSTLVSLADSILASERDPSVCTDLLRTYTRVYEGIPVEETGVSALVRGTSTLDPRFVAAAVTRFQEDIDALVLIQELPFHTSAIHASYDLFRMVAEEGQRKVVITGDGGDELFGGYVRIYAAYAFREAFHKSPLSGIRNLAASGWKDSAQTLAKTLLRASPASLRAAVNRKALGGPAIVASAFYHEYFYRNEEIDAYRNGSTLLERRLADVTKFNLPQLLRHLDRNSMAFGIEARAPFLSRRVVEVAFSGQHQDVIGMLGKQRLREAMRGELPAQIVDRAVKTGFGDQEQYWFVKLIERVLDNRDLSDYVSISRLKREIQRRKGARLQELWPAVCLGLWLDLVVKPNG